MRTAQTSCLVVPLAGCSSGNGNGNGDDSGSDGGDSGGADGQPPKPIFLVNTSGENTLKLTFSAGDGFVAGQVTIEGSNIAESAQGATWADLDDSNGPDETVESGDSIVIEDATEAYDVKLHWESADGSTSEQIYREQGPEA